MVLLSPPKLAVIAVVALIVLGPDKLPATARRIGALWHDVRRWRAHIEDEVRAVFPDLPSTAEVARAVRSPVALLDHLAQDHDRRSQAPLPGTDDGHGSPAAAGDGAGSAPGHHDVVLAGESGADFDASAN